MNYAPEYNTDYSVTVLRRALLPIILSDVALEYVQIKLSIIRSFVLNVEVDQGSKVSGSVRVLFSSL